MHVIHFVAATIAQRLDVIQIVRCQFVIAFCAAVLVFRQDRIDFVFCSRLAIDLAHQQTEIFGPCAEGFASVNEAFLIHIQMLRDEH